MIPTLGLMIGAYIFVRAWEILCTPRESGPERAWLVLLSVGLMIIDLLCIAGLMATGLSTPGIR